MNKWTSMNWFSLFNQWSSTSLSLSLQILFEETPRLNSFWASLLAPRGRDRPSLIADPADHTTHWASAACSQPTAVPRYSLCLLLGVQKIWQLVLSMPYRLERIKCQYLYFAPVMQVNCVRKGKINLNVSPSVCTRTQKITKKKHRCMWLVCTHKSLCMLLSEPIHAHIKLKKKNDSERTREECLPLEQSRPHRSRRTGDSSRARKGSFQLTWAGPAQCQPAHIPYQIRGKEHTHYFFNTFCCQDKCKRKRDGLEIKKTHVSICTFLLLY
jgi:hypothetical protein